MRKITDQMILKAVLLMRRCIELDGGQNYQTKEEQIEEQRRWLAEDPTYADRFIEWIDSLREDLKKTPEQREAEHEEFLEQLMEGEGELAQQEMASMWHDRDEWDDLWDDRARSVGAVWF